MKRLNIKFIAGLLIAIGITTAGVISLHSFQIKRHSHGSYETAIEAKKRADAYFLEAETAFANSQSGEDDQRAEQMELSRAKLEEGDREMQSALRSLIRFIDYHPDHVESQVMFAECLRDSSERRSDQRGALLAWDETIKAMSLAPDNADLRRDAALFAQQYIALKDALLHQEHLVTALSEESTIEDEFYLAQLYLASQQTGEAIDILRSVVGFNQMERQFDEEVARATDNLDVYSLLASTYRNNREESLGDMVIHQMVALNPDNFESHRNRANYLLGSSEDRFEEAALEAEEALRLLRESESSDAYTLLVAVNIYIRQEEYEKAKNLLAEGRTEHATDPRMYLKGIQIARQLQEPEEAMNIIGQGLDRLNQQFHRPLLLQQVNLNLLSGDLLSADLSLIQLRSAADISNGISWRDREAYLEGRILLEKGEWVEAARSMEAIRPTLEGEGSGIDVNQYLARCYANLGQTDLQLEAVRRLIALVPGNLRARLIEVEALQSLGKTSEAAELLEEMLAIASKEESEQTDLLPQIISALLPIRINQQSNKLAELQDWSQVDELLQQLLGMEGFDEAQKELVLITLQETRGFSERARERLTQARENHPDHLGLWLREIQAIHQEEGLAAAFAALDQLEETLGESTATRVTRANYLITRGGENVREELAPLEQDIAGEADKEALWRGLASVYLGRLNDIHNAIRLYLLVAESDPQDLPVRMTLFQLALQADDEVELNRSLNRIATLCGEDDASWQFARALQLVALHQNETAGDEALEEALSKLLLVRQSRPDWHVLARLEADIALAQDRNVSAIEAYQKALDDGPDDPDIQQRLVALLYKVGRTADANRLLRSIPTEALTADLEYRRITGAISEDADLELLRQNIDRSLPADSDDESTLLRRYLALQSMDEFDEAEDALRRAVEVAPGSSNAWITLVRHLVSTGKREEAELALRTAQMRMPESEVPLLLGQGYEELRSFPLAEQAYKMALSANPGNKAVLSRVAQFYFLVNDLAKAEQLLDKILALSTGESFYSNEAKWARRVQAQLLAESNSISDFSEALKLIEMNVEEGQELDSNHFDDLSLWTTLCANRPDSTSRQLAMDRLEEERDRLGDDLSDDLLFVLAKLYYRTSRWRDCEDIMRELAPRSSNNTVLIGTWCEWLLEHEQYREVAKQVEKLDPYSSTYIQIEARRMAQQGETEEAIQHLRGLLAEDLNDVTPNQNDLIQKIAGIFAQLSSYDIAYRDQAENLYRFYVQREPRRVLVLANFLGRQSEPEKLEEAFGLLEEARLELGLTSVLQVAVNSLRVHRETLPTDSSYYTLVEGWFDLWERRFPDAKALHTQRAEFEDIRGNYDEVERRYRLYLAREDIDQQEKAVIQNNLAFVLALRGKEDDALPLIEQAIEQLGPLSDLLDTRAVVYLAQRDYNNAAIDLNRALADGSEPVMLYHLAQAYAPTNESLAKDKLEKAFEFGFDPSSLSPLEKEMFRELLIKLEMEEADFISSTE